jgi:hypothetical protein
MKLLGKADFPGAFGDLRAFFGTLGRRHYVAAFVSLAITIFFVWGFYRESYFEAEPQIFYVESWPANRTDAEIIADQKKDAAELHAEQAARRAEFQKLEKFNEKIGL